MTSQSALAIQLDTDGASHITGGDWSLRACGSGRGPDSIELLIAALGACAAQACAPILARAGRTAETLQLDITHTRDGLRLCEIAITIGGAGELAARLERAIRTCPVARALDPSVSVTTACPP